jgi:putative transposase
MEYHSKNHAKFLILYYLIFVCKYRKALLETLGDTVKAIFVEISFSSQFSLEEMEVDRDHIHCLVQSEPTISPASIVRRLKQESTYTLWQQYTPLLKQHFWKERTFWSDGYFCCTVGNASQEVIRQYIETQG